MGPDDAVAEPAGPPGAPGPAAPGGGRRAAGVLVEHRPGRRTVLAVGAVVWAAVALFVLIAEDVVDNGGLTSHDDDTLSWFLAHRTDAMISVARGLSVAGSFPLLVLYGLGLAAWLWRRGTPRVVAVAPLASLLLAALVALVAKVSFGRDRPPLTVQAATVALDAFPSGHASQSSALCVGAAATVSVAVLRHRHERVLALVVGGALTGLVGVARLVLGVHWLSDVVAGWALGTAVALAVVLGAWALATRALGPPPSGSPEP